MYTVIFEADTRSGRLFDLTLIAFILASVVVVVLDSMASVHARYNELFNLETAVAGSVKRQKASIGAALRQIAGTAEQFQMGDRRPTGIFRRNSNLASFGDANCRF